MPPRDARRAPHLRRLRDDHRQIRRGIFNKLPVLSEETAQKLTDKLNERTGGDVDVEDVLDSETIEEMADYVRSYLDAGAATDGFLRYLRLVPDGRSPTTRARAIRSLC